MDGAVVDDVRGGRSMPSSTPREHGHLGGMLAGKIGSNRFVVDYAVDSRAKCRDANCKKRIPQGMLRVGKIPPAFKRGHSNRTQWYHLDCLFRSFRRMCKHSKTIQSVADVEGFDKLKPDDKERIRLCLLKHDYSDNAALNAAANAVFGGATAAAVNNNLAAAATTTTTNNGHGGGVQNNVGMGFLNNTQAAAAAALLLNQPQLDADTQFPLGGAGGPLVDATALLGSLGFQQPFANLNNRCWLPQANAGLYLPSVSPFGFGNPGAGPVVVETNVNVNAGGLLGPPTTTNMPTSSCNNNNNMTVHPPVNADTSNDKKASSRTKNITITLSSNDDDLQPTPPSPPTTDLPDPNSSKAVDDWWRDAQWIKAASNHDDDDDDYEQSDTDSGLTRKYEPDEEQSDTDSGLTRKYESDGDPGDTPLPIPKIRRIA